MRPLPLVAKGVPHLIHYITSCNGYHNQRLTINHTDNEDNVSSNIIDYVLFQQSIRIAAATSLSIKALDDIKQLSIN